MAREGTELPIPSNEGEEDNVDINVEPVVREEVRIHRECYEEKYRLKVPTFSGEEPVEQFVQEFQDVMEVAQWPPRKALLKLRMVLSDNAKPYGVGPDIDGIFASLRASFGISAVDAQARLQRLRRDPHTPLQEHATTVMRLAAICLKQTVRGILMMPSCNPSTTWDSITNFWRGESPQSKMHSQKGKLTFWRITCIGTV